MKKIFFIVGLFSILFGQKDFVIPFDWAGQNGYIIHNGKLFWNQSWTSGVLKLRKSLRKRFAYKSPQAEFLGY